MRFPVPLRSQILRFIPCLFLSLWCLAGALVITNGRMPDPQEVRPLPDVLFELLPKVREVEFVTDVVIFCLIVCTVFTMLKVYLLERKEKGHAPITISLHFQWLTNFVNRFFLSVIDSGKRPFPLSDCCAIGLIRFLVSYTLVTLFRAIVIVFTSYPATDNHCQRPEPIENPLLNMVLTLVTLGGGAIHCGDLMYSGHTIILCLTTCMLWVYGRYLHSFALRLIPPLLVLLSFYCIIASRSHYTDDILVSAYITIATFLVISHSKEGAPECIQFFIRYWPCLGQSQVTAELSNEEPVTVVVVPSIEEGQRTEESEENLPS